MSANNKLSPFAKLLTIIIRGYQLLFSSFMGRSCRFYPTCSSYAMESVRRHGGLRGLLMIVWRILRCNPWNGGGYDPVPDRFQYAFCCDKKPQHPHDHGKTTDEEKA